MKDQQGKLIFLPEPSGGSTVWLLTQQPNIGVAVYSNKSNVTIGTISHIRNATEHGEIFEGTVHLSCTDHNKNSIKERVKYTFRVDPADEESSTPFLSS